MTYSRRALYAAGEPFGASCTRREGGRLICGGGGGSSKAVTQGFDNRLVTGEGSLGLTGNKNSTVTTGGLSASGKNSSLTAIDASRLTDDRDFYQTTTQTDSRSWADNSVSSWADNSQTAFTQNTNQTDARTWADNSVRSWADNSSQSFAQNTAMTDARTFNDARQTVDSRAWNDASNTNINVTTNDEKIARAAFDFAKAADATNGQGFDSLLGLADRLFQSGEKLIGQTQDRVADAYANAGTLAIDQAGKFDNKTIVVLAGLGAAAVAALAWGKK